MSFLLIQKQAQAIIDLSYKEKETKKILTILEQMKKTIRELREENA